MRTRLWLVALALASGLALVAADGLNPAILGKPPVDSWPTYHGDYTGRRYSTLKQINASNIGSLGIAWVFRTNIGPQRGVPNPEVKSMPIVVNGIAYITLPDHVYALDARTGAELWNYTYVDDGGGDLVANRGVAMYGNWLYMLSPDGMFISVDARNGKERWKIRIADSRLLHIITMAPLIVKNHVLVGVAGDTLDTRCYLEARDLETGALSWRWYVTPDKDEPGIETWPNVEASLHGGGGLWTTGTYDPELNLVYWGTGNVNPVREGYLRKGSNLYTESIVALNADTGKLVWYFDASPHDTHDWDDAETPVLIDMQINGQPRKLLAQAARNGFFFLLDRTNGKYLVSKPFAPNVTWHKGIDQLGQPIPDPMKEALVDGAIVIGSATNWMAQSFSPDTGLFYTVLNKSLGLGGNGGINFGSSILAIDPKTGNTAWEHEYPEGAGPSNRQGGILTTAGNLLFTGDGAGNFLALDPVTGKPIWHFRMGPGNYVTNGAETVMIDNKQYVLVGAGDSLWAFALLPSKS